LQRVANRAHFVGEQFRLVTALAACALVFADVKDFIHPGMEPVRLEGIAHLVNQGEDDLVNLRMARAVALAIKPVRIGPGVLQLAP
jgi:hypothetical protein